MYEMDGGVWKGSSLRVPRLQIFGLYRLFIKPLDARESSAMLLQISADNVGPDSGVSKK